MKLKHVLLAAAVGMGFAASAGATASNTQTHVLMLGATGSLGRVVAPVLLETPNLHLMLYVRNEKSVAELAKQNPNQVRVIQDDVLNQAQLNQAMKGQDIVYAGLSGDLPTMAKNIITVMHSADVKRLIFISSMDIYGETGEDHGSILEPYRQSAKIVESSDVDYTVIRPGWFTNSQEIDYQLTQKGEPFR